MRLARLLLPCLVAFGCGPGRAASQPPALALHEVGPWPWVSSLVAHRDRLWFANSDRTRDRSCADLYSLGLGDGRIRYERHLFSQSVGRPALHEGLLYWPYEDSRFNLGVAHVAVTDGAAWRLQALDAARPLVHATAMASDGRTLWLATASPGLRLFVSAGAGAAWRPVGTPASASGLQWVLRAAPFAGGLYGVVVGGVERGARRALARLDSGRPERVPGLPAGADVLDVAVYRGRLLALAQAGGRNALFASDGARVERLAEGPARGVLRDVAVDAEGRLWALTLEPAGGLVWRRDDTERWQLEARIEGGLPQELEIVDGLPHAAGQSRSGAGALWASAPRGEPAQGSDPRAALPEPVRAGGEDWRTLEARARAALEQPAAYLARARVARAALLALARSDAPPEAFERLLLGPFPDATAPFLEDEIQVPTRQLGPWLALFAIAVSGRGTVPLALLGEPWPAQPLGGREKHFEPLLAALEAISWTGQSDAATLDALLARLGAPGDPDWLRGDVVGALSAATGQRHGYDAEAWRRWWSGARAHWKGRPGPAQPAGEARVECAPCTPEPWPPPS